MKLLIFGATGGTGRALVALALEQDHAVTAFARNPAAIETTHPRLRVVKGDILDRASIDAAMQGQEAVVSALGTRNFKPNTIVSEGTRNILQSMEAAGIRRFICETSLGVGDSKNQTGLIFKLLLQPLLKNVFEDKERQETLIRQSGLDWIIVRPGGLTDGPRTGQYRAGFSPEEKSLRMRISRADVADFMLKQLTDDTYLHKSPGLSY